MKRSLIAGLMVGVASLAWSTVGQAAETSSNDPQRADDVIVTGARPAQAGDQQSASPTGLSLSLRETPQSVTVIDRQRIEDFALTNVQDVLNQTVGINVERTETDRTEFNARGFDITNFQVDGIGLPMFYNIQTGELDTVLYDRVEAVRGANAIMTGVGNPSATINFLRKRPTSRFQANGAAYLGSFGMWRLEGDVSGPVTADGSVRVRTIGAHEEHDSYLDYNHVNRDVVAGLLAWDVTPALTATLGYSRQDNRSRGVLWGALPLTYSDGTRIDYARSASTSADWTYWNVLDQTAFGELVWKPFGDWALRGVVTYRRFEESARLLYAFGLPDRTTGRGMQGQTGRYDSNYDQLLFDGYASGHVSLFGREHQLAFGVSTGRSDGEQYAANGVSLIDYGNIRDLPGFRAPQVAYTPRIQQADTRDLLTRAYGAMHLNLTDRLKGVVGATAIWLRSSGDSYRVDQTRRNSRVTPYLGALYDLTSHVTAYASYTGIFDPQSEVDITNTRLSPARGSSIEAGLKGEWLNGRLYGSAAVFRAEQKGLALYAGQFNGTNGPVGVNYYTGQDTVSKGFEVEMSGQMTDRWLVQGGFTHLQVEDGDGTRARPFIPRDTFKLAATYSIEQLSDLKLGGQFRYQSRISNNSGAFNAAGQAIPVVQDAYATLDLLGSLRVIDHVRASVNLRNVTNAKYLGTLKYGQAFYAAPRSIMATLRFDY